MLRKEREEPAEAHRYLRRAAIRFGSESRAHIRWYDRDGDVDEAYMGIGIVEWARANTGVTDLDAAELTIHGRGRLHEIDNPNNGNGDNGNGGNGGNGDDNGDGEEDQD